MPTFINSLALFLTIALMSCSTGKKSIVKNDKDGKDRPHVILVSLDGFRWDYVERFKPPNLMTFIENGTKAESLIPSYPSKTFPNHYTIATGMYPDHHGILVNSFYHIGKDAIYQIRDRDKVRDGTYYGGTPIWNLAKQAGMITASFFFVGSEALIGGQQPDYYRYYNGRVPNEERIDQAIQWINYPEETRPRFTALYFSDMDNIGHQYGPDEDDKLEERLMQLDKELGVLFDGVRSSGVAVNIIIVSDHGMKNVHVDGYIPVEKIKNTTQYRTVNNGVMVSIHPHDLSDADAIYDSLVAKAQNYTVYKTVDVPFFEIKPESKNWGPIQVLPDSGYYFNELNRIGLSKSSGRTIFGHHGFDTADRDMHGILYVNGPDIKSGFVHPSVKNIHIYPLICEILGLDIPEEVDGELQYIESMLKEN